jgi:hypothetical protein
MGAPDGFIDVVAALDVIADDGSTASANWGVTFTVDDADAIAAEAKRLGGEVVAEPSNAPWSRLTVIRDPQGATFTATQFMPENKDVVVVPRVAGTTG